MRRFMTTALAVFLLLPLSGLAAGQMPQSPLGQHAPAQKYPKVVLFSTSWCPHCKAAKEFFTRNDIPFINRDVELDSDAMELLTGKYKSQGVPVIVIGDDAQVLKGFDEGRVRKALDQYRKK
ncbi:MAG: glutaredoxin family protein [uncultured bacterium]|uniref:Glutaredoxin family protein n=1 Tax=Citrifermentans bemidjiense (strain ATCC BAA-1014 / DSM 16622 / JCM 12645 / Bem) TaxID=404380 RepID=B5EFK1_CITBB|nr:glutaredoxin domain-containing protein [Citrifermentans bemidjiense]ACH37905.1 glutaredoxin family protein [Citrifermentans bemidjiense Bem]EKD59359.1 MAG: glutaredoxin family protein [uncultured bacterium]